MWGTILSMLDGSTTNFLSIYWICGSNALCSASSACQQEIFGGKNFASWHLIAKIAKNFCLAKNFPLYSMCASNLCPLLILITQSLLCLSPSFASLPPLPLSLLCLSPSLSYSPFSLLFLSLSLLFLSFPVALFLSPPRIRQAAASLNFPPPSSAGSTV